MISWKVHIKAKVRILFYQKSNVYFCNLSTFLHIICTYFFLCFVMVLVLSWKYLKKQGYLNPQKMFKLLILTFFFIWQSFSVKSTVPKILKIRRSIFRLPTLISHKLSWTLSYEYLKLCYKEILCIICKRNLWVKEMFWKYAQIS